MKAILVGLLGLLFLAGKSCHQHQGLVDVGDAHAVIDEIFVVLILHQSPPCSESSL